MVTKDKDKPISLTGSEGEKSVSLKPTKILPVSTWQCSRHHHMLDESTAAAQFRAEVP
jgi:hypothetical protein